MSDTIMDQVVKHLHDRKIDASVEYPGYIDIPLQSGGRWAFGDQNDFWSGDLVDEAENDIGAIELPLKNDCQDAELIACKIFLAIMPKLRI